MARSSFGVAFIDSFFHVPYPASGIMERHGFEKADYYGEEVIIKKTTKQTPLNM